jgi:hypothetical protein
LHPLKLEDVTNLLKSAEKNNKISGLSLCGQDLTSPDAALFETIIAAGDVPLKTLDVSCTVLSLFL